MDSAELVGLLGDWTVGPGPLYGRLATALRTAVESGDVPPGERLPAERGLAGALAVSRATVVAAYDQLRSVGLVTSRTGSGTTISGTAGSRQRSDGRAPGGSANALIQRLVDGPGELISLAYAVEPGSARLAEAVRQVLANDLAGLLADVGYHPRGLPALRAALAARYPMPTTADQVLITTGATQAINLAAQLYVRRGSVVVVESPGWPGCLDVFRAVGARLVGVPLDEDGIRVDGLAAAFAEHRPALLYVMPTFHNPTGTLMSTGRRRRIAELAAAHDVPVIEDSAYAGPDGPPPIAAFAPRGAEVLTVGSLAKLVWGGLRIGWVRAPAEIVERLARSKALADLGSPVLDQAVAARLVPDLAALAADRAEPLRHRLDVLTEALRAELPDWRWQRPDGGSALWIELPDTDAAVFAQVALRHGVEVIPGATMDPTGTHDSYIRLPFTFPPPTLRELVTRLRGAWSELRRHGPPAPPHPVV